MPDRLGTLSDIARLLGVPYRTVVSWQQRAQLPEPWGTVGGARVYDLDKIASWYDEWKVRT